LHLYQTLWGIKNEKNITCISSCSSRVHPRNAWGLRNLPFANQLVRNNLSRVDPKFLELITTINRASIKLNQADNIYNNHKAKAQVEVKKLTDSLQQKYPQTKGMTQQTAIQSTRNPITKTASSTKTKSDRNLADAKELLSTSLLLLNQQKIPSDQMKQMRISLKNAIKEIETGLNKT